MCCHMIKNWQKRAIENNYRGIFQFPLLDVKNFFSYKLKERGREGSREGRGLKGKRGVAQSWN